MAPAAHKAGPGPAPGGANSWKAVSLPGACPAVLRGRGEARGRVGGGLLMGSRSSKTSAPLATRSEGRMQEIRGGGVSRRPPPRSCAKHRLPLSVATVCPFQAWLFSPPPLSWRLGKDKYHKQTASEKQSCLLAAVPACPGLPGPPPSWPLPDVGLPQPQWLWALARECRTPPGFPVWSDAPVRCREECWAAGCRARGPRGQK